MGILPRFVCHITLFPEYHLAEALKKKLDKVLAAVCGFCADRRYRTPRETVQIGAWPVQFVPVFSPLTREALKRAQTEDFEGVPFRVVRAWSLDTPAEGTWRTLLTGRSHT